MPDREFTTKEAAEILGVNDSRIRQMILAGILTARSQETPRGKILYVTEASLDAEKRRKEARIETGWKVGRPRGTKPVENIPAE